jgi:hypothetical protein
VVLLTSRRDATSRGRELREFIQHRSPRRGAYVDVRHVITLDLDQADDAPRFPGRGNVCLALLKRDRIITAAVDADHWDGQRYPSAWIGPLVALRHVEGAAPEEVKDGGATDALGGSGI